jgi:hypothetical protein
MYYIIIIYIRYIIEMTADYFDEKPKTVLYGCERLPRKLEKKKKKKIKSKSNYNGTKHIKSRMPIIKCSYY